MEMLDASLALAITLAALATTVTVIMEIWVRFFGLKSKAQIDLFTRIFDDAVRDKFPGDPVLGDFLKKVLANPLHDFSSMKKKALAISEKNGSGDANDMNAQMVPLSLRGTGIYEWVSHEHVYRRLLELDGIVDGTRDEMIARLKAFTLKYEEYCAAASQQFKENRLRWSILGGLLLSIAVNTNGIRIYNEFLKNPELAAAVSVRVGELERASDQAEEKLQAALGGDTEGDLKTFQKTVGEMTASLSGLQSTGIPIGWGFFPHCRLNDKETGFIQYLRSLWEKDEDTSKETDKSQEKNGNSVSTCLLESDRQKSTWALVGAVLAIIGTGLLIGLGAPFWFDVARRLATVRSAFGASAGGDAPYNGESPDERAPPASRTEAKINLITRIVDEVLGGQSGVGERRPLDEEPVN